MDQFVNEHSDREARRQIGVKIIERCHELNMSQTKLAVEAGVDPHTLSDIIAGKRDMRVSTFRKIAKALAVDWSRLQPDELDGFMETPAEIQPVIEELKRVRRWWPLLLPLIKLILSARDTFLENLRTLMMNAQNSH